MHASIRLSFLCYRYKELQPKYEELLNKNTELEKENVNLKETLDEQEERHKNVYLKLYMKGREAAKLEHEHQVDIRGRLCDFFRS